ncbi:MAG: hypothetical protein IVW53_08000 [Chloroflexi bacterium]|nr:hypothetical protein [Chloroflexota bacterium]
MRRTFRLVLHNWPLKLAAIGLAALLYVVLVLSQNSNDWRGQVAIEVRNQPASAVLLGGIRYVTSIRYFAPVDVANRISGDMFSAWIDLSTASPDSSNDFVVAVNVTSPDPQVQVLDWTPRLISVRLDPLREKVVPVQVDSGTAPSGLEVRPPIVDVTQVTVSGTQSNVSQVVAAVARVRIDPSGVSIDQQVDLEAIDARGIAVSQVHLNPSSVRVRILVGSQLQSRSLPVNPIVTGTPATGYTLTSVDVAPLVVTVEGDIVTLKALTKLDTQPLSVTGAASDVTGAVGLVLPPGVAVLGTSTISITARVSAATGTRTFSVGPVLAGARQDRVYTLSTAQVLVTIGGSAADLATIQGDALVLIADVNGLAPGVHDVPLKATLPAGLTVVAVSPPTIGVTIGPLLSPSPSPSGP